MQTIEQPCATIVDYVQQQWARALRERDWDALVSLYTADAQLFGGKPDLFTGRDGVRRYFEALPRDIGILAAFGVRNVVQPASDIIVSAGYVSFSREGTSNSALPHRITLVLARRGGEWRIASHHASPRGH